MRKCLFAGVLAVAGVFASSGRASAFWFCDSGPYYISALFPCGPNPGWSTSRYYFAWQYPWYAYYNYSHSPYAGWGGFATYGNCAGGSCGYGPAATAAAGTGAYCGPTGCGFGPAPMNYGYRGYGPTFGVPSYDYPRDYPGPLVAPGPVATVSVTLPADAKLLFNGTPAEGTGAVRTFRTTPLVPGQSYSYDLTAEVVRDGRTVRTTERVVVRAGEESKVTLSADGVRTAGK